jgi:hypothetical protein
MVCDESTGQCVPESTTCDPACGPNTNCTADGECVCVSGYSNCNSLPGDGCECDGACAADGTCEGGTPPPPDNCSTKECPPDKICDEETGECIDKPTPAPTDAIALLKIYRLTQEGETQTLGEDGKAARQLVWFHEQDPLPPDNRQVYTTSEGETCTYDETTSPTKLLWPGMWPESPTLGAGNVTFSVDGAPGPIVVEASNMGGDWNYFRKEPDDMPNGYGWFSPDYLPFGASYTVTTAGGPDLGPMTFNGRIPADFTISAPIEKGQGEVPEGDLTVTWTPPAPASRMEILLTQADPHGYQAELRCSVTDDGSATIPAAAVANFSMDVFLEMHRINERYGSPTDAQSGKVVHTTILADVQHRRWFTIAY